LPVVVSVAGKYIDIPEEIKEQAKPPTGETLLRIKGILPSVSHDFIIIIIIIIIMHYLIYI